MITSVSFLPLICFSLTHMRTSLWKSLEFFATFSAAIFARAVPQDPDPIIATLCFPDGKGEGGSAATGEDGRVIAGVVTVEPISSSENSLVGEDADDDMVVAELILVVGRRLAYRWYVDEMKLLDTKILKWW